MNHHLHPWITRSQRQMQHNLLGHSGVSRWNKFPFSKPLKQSLIMGTEIVPENLETHSALTWLTAHLTQSNMSPCTWWFNKDISIQRCSSSKYWYSV